nr:cell division protein ZipA C-terminal FtsZ-binding domain-containing protein [Coxiella-like endosymbiont]
MRYGEKNIFYRHEMKTGRGQILFNLASVNKPGTFELSKMGSFSCPGLVLFLLLKRVPNPMTAFDSIC